MMEEKPPQIYQFKITLEGVEPAVWRRIQVPDSYTFWDLHVAIQDAMGWQEFHLHEFELANPKTGERVTIGIPDEEINWTPDTVAGWKVPITDYFDVNHREAGYTYDFGDDWQHQIFLEAIEQADPEFSYPRCTAGTRACPPEDVGGPWGYEQFLQAIHDPAHSRRASLLAWVGGSFEPEHFDPEEVAFNDPQERWQLAIGDEGAA